MLGAQERFVKLAQYFGRLRFAYPYNNAVRLFKVVDRCTFLEKFRIAGDKGLAAVSSLSWS